MDYILKASAVLFIFYACYQLFLQKETFFQANRWFLLSGLIISCVIPLVVIPVYIEYTVTNNSNFLINYDNLTPTQTIIEEPFDYMQLIIWTYFAGILFFFGKLIVDFLSLRKVINSSKTISLGSFKLLETTRNITPFSFFDRIVYNPKQFEKDELTHIINHEKAHTQQWHSIDTIISQLACVLFWFNPIVWLYKKALQQNLEFIADQKAQHISPCEKSYQTVLLKTSVQNHQLAITNNFYTSLIKKRIVMLHKSKSSKINQFKSALVLPLLAFFMMSFNTEDIYVEIPLNEEPVMELIQTEDIEQIFTKDMSDADLVLIKKKLEDKGVSFDYSGVKRDKNGDITAIRTKFEYNGNSGTYNVNSDKTMEPFIFKSSEDSFVVGTFTDRNPKIYKTHKGQTKIQSTGSSNSRLIEADSIFFTKQSNHLTKEGDSIFINRNSKIQTWISNDGKKTTINASENGNANVFVSKSEDPLIIIDGKIAKKSTLKNLDTNNIKSMNVLKDKSAIEAYGDKGKNGVIVLKTKSKNPWAISGDVQVQTFEIDETTDSTTYKIFSVDKNDKKTYEFVSKKSSEEKPLYILDDKIISQKEFQLIDANNIKSMNVIKDENAIKIYGEKGKNGVIIIKSKIYAFVNGSDKALEVEVEDNNPWKIKTAVTTVIYEDDNGKVTAEYILTKNSSDSFLEKQKRELIKHGIEAKFTKVKRNKAGEITSIKIALDDNDGRKSSASWKEKNQAIPDIVMGKSSDDKLYVRAIGN
ncbi:M56 family metallopeptidase [Psychroserpens luteus]|uniref:M56 family metallopeptidase n=1 Tax=Psychroserpens luteus TaxID=1434066 RepID=A0ABW5ZR28_9FLAO|nr:M56 family metallopeptidase [Psychroserpens luteus]